MGSYLSFLLSTGSLAPTSSAYSNESQLNDSPARMLQPLCSGIDFVFTLRPDWYGDEITWALTNKDTGNVPLSGGPLPDYYYCYGNYDGDCADVIEYPVCLDPGCYEFVIYDSGGDGLRESQDGSYKLTVDGNIIREGGDYGASESTSFCSTSTSAPAPTSSPTSAPAGSCPDSPLFGSAGGGNKNCSSITDLAWCERPGVKSHCPDTCNACDEYACLDSEKRFLYQGNPFKCRRLARLGDADKDRACSNIEISSTCRGSCNVCAP